MSIFSSLYVGMSGMRTNEGAISVIGNNIANVNTVGFKASRAVFADILSQTILGSAGATQQGQGAALAAVQRLVTQGALLGTNVTTDLAINGDGYFIVGEDPGGHQYTRNGQLQIDENGYLTTVEGLRLQGYAATDGVLATRLSSLEVNSIQAPPLATTEIAMDVQLNRADFEPLNAVFDVNDPEGTSQYQQSITVYDSLGEAHQVEVYFTQTSPGQWEWNAVVPQGDIDGTDTRDGTVVAAGSLVFDEQGNLQTENQSQSTVQFFGAAPQDLTFDFGEAIDDGGDGSGSSSYAATSSLNFVNQNGYGVGTLSYLEIDPDGNITGTFTNGREQLLGRLALARFQAPDQLNALGDNLFAESEMSGEPIIGVANTGGRGEIFSGALEQSTVDLTNEFTQLITAQRGFQAASRTITTADEMLVEVVNLKR
ncbi:MAG: flagellar hook protein FlgE [Deltaproteobacteria bacterium]|nr:flagellar hook protein FlgE [Deltaproteobacteria bacterium]